MTIAGPGQPVEQGRSQGLTGIARRGRRSCLPAFLHIAVRRPLGLSEDSGPEVGDQAVDRLGLAEVDQPWFVGIPGPEDERHVPRRLPNSLHPERARP